MIQSIDKAKQTKSLIEDLRGLVKDDWMLMDQEIEQQLSSDIGLINSISSYIINSGGKRLRPLLVLLSSKACGIDNNREAIKAAAMIEFIHTATLLHDDVVDNSDTRRGSITAHKNFGNEETILVGDFLYSRAFQIMVEIGNMRIMEIMSEATNRIAEGEVMQLINCGNPDTNEQQYMEVIYRKTAKLFESAAKIGAVLSGQSNRIENSLNDFGRELGIAYQLIDDVLDYNSSFEVIGKDIGDDLSEGKPTLPLIYALKRANPNQQIFLRNAISQKDSSNSNQVIEIIESTGSLALATKKAEETTKKAIGSLRELPNNKYKEALIELSEFSFKRTF
jgi:octaprenyl-diphosphate synthase